MFFYLTLVHKYDKNYNMTAGTAHALKFSNGVECNFNGQNISEELTDDVHVYVYFKEDQFEA